MEKILAKGYGEYISCYANSSNAFNIIKNLPNLTAEKKRRVTKDEKAKIAKNYSYSVWNVFNDLGWEGFAYSVGTDGWNGDVFSFPTFDDYWKTEKETFVYCGFRGKKQTEKEREEEKKILSIYSRMEKKGGRTKKDVIDTMRKISEIVRS